MCEKRVDGGARGERAETSPILKLFPPRSLRIKVKSMLPGKIIYIFLKWNEFGPPNNSLISNEVEMFWLASRWSNAIR